jgi:putative DNA primase/helicase
MTAGNDPSAPTSASSNWATLQKVLGPIRWDWPGWLPCGFLTILASEPGAGKSLLCLRLAGSYLSNLPWPDGTPFAARPGQVLWCEAESSQALNLQRASSWGLDLSRIVTPVANPLYNFRLDNTRHFKALLHLAGLDAVSLIVLDSLRGLRSSSARNMPLSDVLSSLADLARIVAKPVVLTHHLRKRSRLDDGRTLTLDRLLGSSAIAQTARIVWALDAPDPAHREHQRLSVIKSNLAPLPDPLGMSVDDRGPHFGPAPSPPNAYSELDSAVDFLGHLLAPGPLPANQVAARAAAVGLSPMTVRRAKRALAVVSLRLPGRPGWHWALRSHHGDQQAG